MDQSNNEMNCACFQQILDRLVEDKRSRQECINYIESELLKRQHTEAKEVLEGINQARNYDLWVNGVKLTGKKPKLVHDCQKFASIATVVNEILSPPETTKDKEAKSQKEAVANDPQAMPVDGNLNYRVRVENILSHHYRPQGLVFKVKWANFDIETQETKEVVMKNRIALQTYIQNLSSRARNTILKRYPEFYSAFKD